MNFRLKKALFILLLLFLAQEGMSQATFRQVCGDAHERRLDFFIFEDKVYNTCTRERWAKMSEEERKELVEVNTAKGNACLLFQKYCEKIGRETDVIRNSFSNESVLLEARVDDEKDIKSGKYKIHLAIYFSVDLKRDRIKYLVEDLNQLEFASGIAVLTEEDIKWIDRPCEKNDLYKELGIMAKEIRRMLRGKDLSYSTYVVSAPINHPPLYGHESANE